MLDNHHTLVLRIALADVEPAVWRRVLVPEDIHLGQLHEAIQCIMSWEDAHLYEFHLGRARYGTRHREFQDATDPVRPARGVSLAEVLSGRQQRLKYVYDLGDYWVHEIAVEEVLATDTEEPVLLCVAGEGQCPPEDIGGAFGYEDFLEAIADPSHEAHVHHTDWIGGDFDRAISTSRKSTRASPS